MRPVPHLTTARRAVILSVTVALLLGGLNGVQQEAECEPTWTPVKLKPAGGKALRDLRSPILAHERALAPSVGLRIAGELIPRARLEPRSKRPDVIVVSHRKLKRYTLCVRPGADGKELRVGSAQGVAIPLGKQTGYLVDSDLDGVLGSSGDGYVAPGCGTVGAWRGIAWGRMGGVEIRGTSTSGFESRVASMPHPKNKDHCRAWALLQWRRQQCGLHVLGYDRSLEAGMVKHAEYLTRHGAMTHEEDPKLEGYTKAGDEAGRGCIMGHGDTSSLTALEMQLATLYHRTRCLQPGLTHTAIVFHQDVFMLNVFSRRGGPLASAVLVYPPHGMQDVLTNFHPAGEHPMPVKGVVRDAHHLGTAVGLYSKPLSTATTLAGEPKLTVREAKRRKKAVEGAFHYPGHSPTTRAGVSNRGCVTLVPTRPLRGSMRYAAEADIVLPSGKIFHYEWTFDTIR